MPPTRIYLTGFMGSGKSTVGPRLAARLGRPFVDLDAAVATRAGRPVAAVFAEAGEAAFRALEATCLRATAEVADAVVALGGGALATEDNLTWALAHGTVVYLRVPADVLARRLARTAGNRPLLQGEDGQALRGEALAARVSALLAAREHFYGRAHVVIDTAGQSVAETVAAVQAAAAAR